LLPKKLRDPIALAYLLARATDTIADTSEISAEIRAAELKKLAARIQGQETNDDSLKSFAALQKNEAERTLIHSVPTALAWLRAMPGDDRSDITAVLSKINEGQQLDVLRFADSSRTTALQTATELNYYAFLVAGCVGEFWTNVGVRHLPKFATRPRQEMVSLGVEYGKGLQLINILRDLGADLRAGRCYLPREQLEALGVSPNEILREPSRALPIVNTWLERAERGIAAGIEYACALRPPRVRIATALPALIGARTLAQLRTAGTEIFARKIKISRGEVRGILSKTLLNFASPSSLRSAHKKLSS
jgi:farnesyl-diphosphate farnesyltransferase